MEYIISFMETYGYTAMFIAMVLENANVPIPSEIVLGFAGYLIAQGIFDMHTTMVKRTQRERNIMVVMVLHDLNLALRYSDRIIAIKEGAIVGDGAPHMMMTAENLANWFGIKADILQSPRSEETCPICVPYGLA